MLVWPFILLTLGLTAGLGYVISQVERDKIMQNWEERRCEVPIMTMGSYFKPADDPRTPSQFSKDNFSFCMDRLAKAVTSEVLTPLGNVFTAQSGIAGTISNAMNVIRTIIKAIYDKFMEFISGFMKKYVMVAQQVRAVTLHLKAAFQRANAIVFGMVFMGLTMIQGMMNTMSFVFKVVLIILAIMIILLIILFFILLPFMPIMMGVIAAIVAGAVGAMAGTAASYGSSFCFAPDTLIAMADGTSCNIKDIRLGAVLSDRGVVESVMKMSGKSVKLWNMNGIYVTGSHLVESRPNSNSWHSVATDSRAVKTSYREGYIYCLNTTTHTIPVNTTDGSIITFRDWEELADKDAYGHYEWNYRVLQALNSSKSYKQWADSINSSIYYPAVAPSTYIETPLGNRRICDIHIGDLVYDQNHIPTDVIGIIHSTTRVSKQALLKGTWATNMIYKVAGVWKRMVSNTCESSVSTMGMHLITEEGSFITVDNSASNISTIYRDFTEVGYTQIETINHCVEDRLRIP